MSITLKSTKEIRVALNKLIGPVTAKNLFTGYGLFKDNLMFGIYQNNILYIRAEEKFAEYLKFKGAISYLKMSPKSKLNIGNYYKLPKALIEDEKLYKKILIESIVQIKSQKIAREIEKKNRIKDLFNLSIKHERLLAKIDIYDVKTFRMSGDINCYVKLKKQGLPVNLTLFWNFKAALLNKNVNLLTEKEKEAALVQLNHALFDAGLRKIKTIEYKK